MEKLELNLIRTYRTENSTVGLLYVDNKFRYYTLEDVERDVKIMHETCIPKGRYKVSLTFSQRFQKVLPLIENVPGFEGIRIHPGNTKEDTSGCILPGKSRGVDRVNESRAAFDEIMTILTPFKGEIWLNIK